MATYTKFKFFRNTPLVNFQKSMNFLNNAERDRFFDSGIYSTVDYTSKDFNMVRDRLTVNVEMEMDKYMGINYCYFTYKGTRYYCQVVKYEYVNDKVLKFYLGIDVLMTFFQGDFAATIGQVNVQRQHLIKDHYKNAYFHLASRDYLQVTQPVICHQKFWSLYDDQNNAGNDEKYDKFHVVFQCSADLSADFGDYDEPVLKTSKGVRYDNITSPVNLYAVALNDANKLFDALSDYPWISQNIKQIMMIPDKLIDTGDLKDVTMQSGDFQGLKEFENGKMSRSNKGMDLSMLQTSFNDMINMMTSDESLKRLLREDNHLINHNYFKILATNWSGRQVTIEPEMLPSRGLEMHYQGVVGYDNKAVFYVEEYGSSAETGQKDYNYDGKKSLSTPRGMYLDASLQFDAWDTLPIMIDNYKMSLANSAYQRKLTENNMIQGQVGNVLNPESSTQDKFFSAMNVVSMLNPTDLFGHMSDQWNYYRQLKAQQDQAKINPPTVTSQATGNAFSTKTQTLGITLKFYRPSLYDLRTAARYHKECGYIWDRRDYLDSVRSMSHINYLKFNGEWSAPGIPAEFMQVAKSLFEQGVSLYHNPDHRANPFTIDVEQNRRVI